MSPTIISWVVFARVFAGMMLGIVLLLTLPKHHLNEDSKDAVKLGMGLIATMAALVGALLIASAKSSHDMQTTEVTQMSSDFILLDRTLARYGPETKDVRSLIPMTIANVLDQTWLGDTYRTENLDRALGPGAETFYERIQELEPRTSFQRALYTQTLQISFELRQAFAVVGAERELHPNAFPGRADFLARIDFHRLRSLRADQLNGNRAPVRLRAVRCQCCFPNPGLDRPFQGLMQISSVPLPNALLHLGK